MKRVISLSLILSALCIGCTPDNDAQKFSNVDKAIRALAVGLPRKVDAATTMVEVKGDGQGGIIYVAVVDTTMINMPSTAQLKHILCDVGPDANPGGHNPFSGITYIYRDVQGHALAQLHFGPGECPGQEL